MLDAPAASKIHSQPDDQLFAMRVAYQTPLAVTLPGADAPEVALPYTFEDALVFENLAFFAALQGTGLVRKFRDAIEAGGGTAAIGEQMYLALKTGKKAEFALAGRGKRPLASGVEA